MTHPQILGLATGVPAHRYTQTEIYDGFLAPHLDNRRARMLFDAAEIDTRHSVITDPGWLACNPSTEARNDFYLQQAQPLGHEVAQRALANADLSPADIDDFILVSCTGFDSPGLDVVLARDLGMPPTLRRTAIIGMGCFGFFPALRHALGSVARHPGSRALILNLELTTIHFQHDRSLRNVIASAIFADGASAVIVGQGQPGQLKIIDTLTYSDLNALDHMAFHVTDKGFKMNLSPKIPEVLQGIVPHLVEKLLQPHRLSTSNVRFWGIHPGGAKILDYLEPALELDQDELRFSREVLRRCGNMSSPTIVFVLEAIMRDGDPRPGDYGILMAFGPGLTIELGLVQW